MGKDKTTNILYWLGVIGNIMFFIGGTYVLISGIVWAGTEMIPFDRVLMSVGSIAGSFGALGIYHDTGSYVPIIPFIFFNLYQVIGILLSPFLHVGYFTPAYLVTWTIMLIAFGFLGYSFYMTRDEIGGIATISGILYVTWAFIRIAVGYGIAVTEDPLYYQLRAVGEAILNIVAAIYYIIAIRIGQQTIDDISQVASS